MKQIVTKGVVLNRLNYGEADRIITVLTPDQGKLRLMVRGARRAKSKLAGGIELFSVSDITFMRGRGDIGTLVSSRLNQHFGNIVKNIELVNLAYEILKIINKNTEDEVELGYYNLLVNCLESLDDSAIASSIIRLYFGANLLRLAGHMPSLNSDEDDKPLLVDREYGFDVASASFGGSGRYSSDHIKLLRLVLADNSPKSLARINHAETLASDCLAIINAMTNAYLRN